jgi:site-specific recombinase XerD
MTLYNSGARVSEITTLKQGQIRFAEHTYVQLLGKGRKERTIPLWADTARLLRGWFQELGEGAAHVAFPSARGTPLSRDGVDYLLKQTVQRAVAACPSLATKAISPHVIRHNPAYLLIPSHFAKAGGALA